MYLYIYLLWDWGLNSGLCTLSLEPWLQFNNFYLLPHTFHGWGVQTQLLQGYSQLLAGEALYCLSHTASPPFFLLHCLAKWAFYPRATPQTSLAAFLVANSPGEFGLLMLARQALSIWVTPPALPSGSWQNLCSGAKGLKAWLCAGFGWRLRSAPRGSCRSLQVSSWEGCLFLQAHPSELLT
jgi:hypothetical protein